MPPTGSVPGTSTSQGITQNASQGVSGTVINSTISQTIIQNANQNITFYTSSAPTYSTGPQTRTITVTTQQFLVSFHERREFIMPFPDIDYYVVLVPPRVQVLYVDIDTWNGQVHYPGSVYIPLESLYTRLNELSLNMPIAVVSNNCYDAAVAMTILRMNGYNSWVAQGAIGFSGGVVSSTSSSATVSGTTTTGPTPPVY